MLLLRGRRRREEKGLKEREKLVSWCFKPRQPQRITSGLRETFIKRYIVQRTSTTEIRPGEQSEKAESCWENLRDEAVERAIQTETDSRTG